MIVAKNTLACIALSKRSDLGFLEGEFVGPVLLIYSDDVVGVSKVIAAFSKKNKSKMVVKCAAYEKVKLKREDVARFASLQSLDHVRVQLMRLIAFNINARLVRCLNYIGEQNKD